MKHVTLSLCLVPGLVSACAGRGADNRPILDGPPGAAFQSGISACQALGRDRRWFDQETAGAASAGERREAMVVECLRGRGHRVVG